MFPIKTFLFIPAKAAHDEVLHLAADLEPCRENHLSRCYLLSISLNGLFSEGPRDLSHHHLISDDSKGPDVTFIAVSFLAQNLGSHVGWSPHHCFQRSTLLLVLFGKPEIGNLQHIIFDQDVLRFQIAVSNSMLGELPESVENLNKAFESLFFLKTARFEKRGPQISPFSQLKDDVEVVQCFMNIIEPDDIGAFQLFVDLYLCVEGIFGVLVLHDFIFAKDFDCDFFFGVLFNA